jgi:hypothetical protein
MYCIEVTKTYNSSDDLPSLKEVGYSKTSTSP